ncbi:MAG: DUF3576 domain-containing protein [Alphaproteobacteria bacterium]|nr:DUF3576 domain-containing protein [Alphaproteobacteria bacterium]
MNKKVFLFLGLMMLFSEAVKAAEIKLNQDVDSDFLWNAAIAKTSFMTNINADRESGRIVAGWTEIDNKLYELNVRILGKELKPDNVKVRIRERLRSGQGWSAPQVNMELTSATEAAIFDRARVLYNNSLNMN